MLRVLGLMAYWYTGSALHQIPQSYHNEVHGVIGNAYNSKHFICTIYLCKFAN